MTIPETVLNVLALNSGSSSLKFGFYRVDVAGAERLFGGEETSRSDDARQAVYRIADLIERRAMPSPDAIGHRVVHGGVALSRHCVIDGPVFQELESAIAFAPLHMPSALSIIQSAQERFPRQPHVACFDTAFHADLPDVARVLPVPMELQAKGIRRYGFHGLSCESIVRRLVDDPPKRLVIAHLGNGASITAIRDGKSIDTSMGLTPTGGVIMGTRTGDLDPGALIYLMNDGKLTPMEAEELVNRRSGLLGISGLSSDMQRLREAAAVAPNARLAVEMFCYSTRKGIAAMVAALGGVDAIVFTGGIGEHDPHARAEICKGLSWLGVRLDDARNLASANPISEPTSRCSVLALPADEEQQIARHTWQLAPKIAGGKQPS